MTPGIRIELDIIGDTPGQADKLVALLDRMGDAERAGAWQHPKRQAILVGDLIDRSPQQLRAAELARAMVERGQAQAILGNHECRLPEAPLPAGHRPVHDDAKPVFLGHYWLTGTPQVLSPKAACLDCSAGRGGPLVAYRWGGEAPLDSARLVSSD